MEKIKLGAYPYIYPMPTVIVGSTVDGNPNFLTVSYVGIVQQTPPMVSVALMHNHYSNAGIKQNNCFSINIPNTRMLAKTDFLGMNSGKTINKAALFDVFYDEDQQTDHARQDRSPDIKVGESHVAGAPPVSRSAGAGLVSITTAWPLRSLL